MDNSKIKQSFLNAAHVTLNAGGNALAWTPVGGLVLGNALGNAWGNHETLLQSAMNLDAQTALTCLGMIAVGLAAAGAGYAHKLGGEPAARKSKLAHAFNFAASSVGAAAIAVGALATASVIDNGSPLANMLVPAVMLLGGGAAFTVGHKRMFGATLPALPAPSAPK